MTGPMGEIALDDVSVDGNSVSFKAEVNTPMGKVNLAFEGTVDGDSISGQVNTSMGSNPFSGTRQ